MTETQRILMERDGYTAEEAKELMEETREMLIEGDYDAVEYMLGLEPDYIFDLI